MSNPYACMIELFRDEGKHFNPPTLGLGTVLSISPLKIRYKDMSLTKENLKINRDLLEYEKEFSLECKGEVDCAPCTGTLQNINIDKQKIKFLAGLKVNNEVLLYPTDNEQIYILVCVVI